MYSINYNSKGNINSVSSTNVQINNSMYHKYKDLIFDKSKILSMSELVSKYFNRAFKLRET